MELSNLIRCYDNVLPESFCNFFINYFEANKTNAKRFENNGYPNFTRVDFTTLADEDLLKEMNTAVAYMFHSCAQEYAKDVDMEEFFPKDYSFELIRIKKYETNDYDEFKLHVDVGDRASSTRFLNMFCYLNDVAEGGETTFPNLGLSFKPKKGSLLVFPPYWFLPHTGEKPISNPKYLLATNLHYGS